MVVVGIVGILATIAVPAYNYEVRKSRRTDAKNAVLDLAGREERLYSTTSTYWTDPGVLGYTAAPNPLPAAPGAAFGQLPVGNGYYQITVTQPTAQTTYTVTATPLTADQNKDTSCAAFVVDQTGKQSSTNTAGADSTSICWK
jgi:type IV pilus assembly protein PilE